MLTPSTLIVLATVVINMTGVGLFWPILPMLVQELGGGTVSQTAALYGAISVVFALMQFIFAPMMGALSDRFGRRPVLLVALAGMGFDSILLALAPSIAWVFAGRALGGIFGATFSVANAYMADISKSEDRAAAFGLVGAAFGLGFILGPLLGGVLGEIDLRLPAFAAAALSFLNVVFGWFFLRESLPEDSRSATPMFKTNFIASFNWLAASPVILPLAIALLIANTMQRGLESIWVLFTGVQYGWGAREAGISLAVVGISFVIVQGFLVRRIVARLGEAATIAAGFSLSALMYLLLSVNESGLVGFIGIVPHVIGWGAAGPALQALASQQVAASQQGYLQGALTSITGLAAIAGPIIATGTFAWFTSESAPFAFPGAYFLGGGILLFAAAWIGSASRRGRKAG
ncbi:MAG: MFS transporter [Phyllobacteriaceae bacterium]|nr:MFS transporter [Phyllobacteriaceae bacterium]